MLSRISVGQSRLEECFLTLKTNLELDETFDEIIQRKHAAVRSAIENIRPKTKTQLLGSLQRRTRIMPGEGDDFDIDILVVLGEFFNWVLLGGISPSAALNELRGVVSQSDRYDSMNPKVDQPTVSFEYADGIQVELVPAYLDKIGRSPDGTTHSPVGRGYWVPKNGRWELTDPDFEADHISTQNTLSGGWLVPTIKMLKAIKRVYFADMSSFHLEIVAARLIPLIVAYYKEQNLPISYPALITVFFNQVSRLLSEPVKMPGSVSRPVDLESTKRQGVLQMIEKIKAFCNTVAVLKSDAEKVQAWKKLFGKPFPAE